MFFWYAKSKSEVNFSFGRMLRELSNMAARRHLEKLCFETTILLGMQYIILGGLGYAASKSEVFFFIRTYFNPSSAGPAYMRFYCPSAYGESRIYAVRYISLSNRSNLSTNQNDRTIEASVCCYKHWKSRFRLFWKILLVFTGKSRPISEISQPETHL